MALPIPEAGLVVSYAFLWSEEHAAGFIEGRKDRPCVVVLAVRAADGGTVVTVAPVTHARPAHDAAAIELPIATKLRLGLDDARSWVVLGEVNEFVWPGPDLRPVPGAAGRFEYGFLPPGLFRQMRDRLLALDPARVRRDE